MTGALVRLPSSNRASKHPLVPDLTARWRSHDDGSRAWAVPGTPAHERARNGARRAWQLPLSIVGGHGMNAPVVQLGTRIPERLRRALRVYCVESEVSVEDFVAQALAERLGAPASHAVRHDHLDGRPGAAGPLAGDGPQPRPHLAGADETASRWMRGHYQPAAALRAARTAPRRPPRRQAALAILSVEAVLRATRLHHARRRGRAATHATHSAARWARSAE